LLRSLVISIVMFVITFSVVTQEFPPDFSRIPKMVDQFKKLKQVSQEVLLKRQTLKLNQADADDETVRALEELNAERARLGLEMLSPGSTMPIATNDLVELRKRQSLLERKVLELENKLDQLTDKVDGK